MSEGTVTTPATRTVEVEHDGMTLGYRELGSGPPVLLLHGWPTSSFLWRRVMPAIAERNRVLALDLPGFGASDKPLDVVYDFAFFERALDGFLAALGIDAVAVAGHDIGGPIAVHWALDRRERVPRIALLNTLVYPEFSEAVLEFVRVLNEPEARDRLTSPEGLAEAMRLGVADEGIVSDEVVAGVVEPFRSPDSRLALARAGIGLEPAEFVAIADRLPELDVPVRVLYGEQDRILPDIAQTVARLERELPQAKVTSLTNCGHFLQEEEPDRVGALLADFFG